MARRGSSRSVPRSLRLSVPQSLPPSSPSVSRVPPAARLRTGLGRRRPGRRGDDAAPGPAPQPRAQRPPAAPGGDLAPDPSAAASGASSSPQTEATTARAHRDKPFPEGHTESQAFPLSARARARSPPGYTSAQACVFAALTSVGAGAPRSRLGPTAGARRRGAPASFSAVTRGRAEFDASARSRLTQMIHCPPHSLLQKPCLCGVPQQDLMPSSPGKRTQGRGE
ncbi:uncharacterized protein O8D03_008728 [Erethizon dorsatum]